MEPLLYYTTILFEALWLASLIHFRLLILVAFASMVSWVVRYRFLNMYTRLPPEPQRKEPHVDLFTDVPDGDSKPGLSNYLDEFLSAIKVFGYLERPVFHELTRTMQTRKLIAGETLMLEEEKGFCLVVDGMVQIFVKSGRDAPGVQPPKDDTRDGHQDYQLLTEVKNGSPMSSLFSILSLFTEDVRLRHDDERPTTPGINGLGIHGNAPPVGTPGGMTPLRPPFELDPSRAELRNVPPFSLDGEPMSRKSGSKDGDMRTSARRSSKSFHPDIVARATTDTTIAIIPASAFKRLTRIYPKATAHIVQVILTRLQRVTLATAHSYLGLTSEVLQTEKLMDRYTTHDLPNHLRGSALERLKKKFSRERERLGEDDDDTKGIALHNARAGHRRRSSSSVRNDLAAQAKLAALRMNSKTPQPPRPGTGAQSVSPGDLLGNLQAARRISQPLAPSPEFMRQTNRGPFIPPGRDRDRDRTPLARSEHESPFHPASPRMKLQRQESHEEDDMFRNSIVDCITKAIGLVNTRAALHEPSKSVEQSPRLVSFDARRNIGTFSNAFDFLGPFEASLDGETESMVSGGASATGSIISMEAARTELADEVEIVYFPQGSVLVETGERNPGLYYVIEGFLDVCAPETQSEPSSGQAFDLGAPRTGDNILSSLNRTNSNKSMRPLQSTRSGFDTNRKSLFDVKPGGIAGYVGTISSYRSFIDVRAKTDVYVGFLPRASVERLVEKYPVVLLTMAKRLTSLLPRLLLHIDFALGWEQINAGDSVYHQGDASDAIYIVLNGRLRAVTDKEKGRPRVTGEYGQGESVGELEVLTESVRPATLHAIRDTEMTRFPRSLFNSLALEHPGITLKISKIVAQRMRALTEDPMFDQKKAKTTAPQNTNVTSSLNMRTVCILPVSNGVPVIEFGSRLLNALSQIGVANGVTSLNQAAILNHLGRHAFSKMGKLKLSAYLADLEERYGMLLYVADTNVSSPWTQTCISQADCILIVGLAEGSPDIGDYERFLLGMKTTARKELVLLHIERYVPQGLTRKWLSNRLWINGGHHHVQMSFRVNNDLSQSIQAPNQRKLGNEIRRRVQVIQAEIQKYTSRRIRQQPLYSAETPHKGDFHRLARRLCGKSVGLVLGGGGARGIAHVGIIRALEEAGIPIDIVGGTSIGSFIGGLYARDADLVPMYGRAKKFAGRMGSMWRFALDVTYPTASYTTGHEFNRGIFKAFGQSQMEDFWLEYYCNTTNISKSRSEIHRSGYAWRYIRASMTLAGLLPPLCDEGSMLLDGGYVDNLTVAHMKSLGADTVFAIDVGSVDDNTPQEYGDSLSGIWTVFNRWNPFSPYPNPPTLSEIQARLAYVSSHDALERAKATPGCLYMRPPIEQYGTLEFGKFDEIYEVGYKFGVGFLAELRERGVLPIMEETEEKKNLRRTLAPRRASV